MSEDVVIAVAPSIGNHGYNGANFADVAHVYEVLELKDALTRTYGSDAHLVACVIDGVTRQPRINKASLADPVLAASLHGQVFFADFDAKHDVDKDEAFRAKYRRFHAELPILRHAGMYTTRGGVRVVQPLAEKIPAGPEFERYLWRWLCLLKAAGMRPDEACKDWTRHFRLPNVVRSIDDPATRRKVRRRYSAELYLERMAPISIAELPPAPDETTHAVTAIPARRPRPATEPIAWTAQVPRGWERAVPLLAAAAQQITDGRHGLYLALTGALADRGVALEHLPAIVKAVAQSAGNDPKVEDRQRCAETTVHRVQTGQPIKSYGSLRADWPTVADALDAALLRVSDSTAPPLPSLAESEAAILDQVRHAPDGVTIVSAECGLGKTRAAIEVAIERAHKEHSKGVDGVRAPLGSKTVFSVDKHELAIEIAQELERRGVPVLRLFGPLSLKNADGSFVCKKHHVALPLQEGGQSVRFQVCDGRDVAPCEYAPTCAARSGSEGAHEARVVVGTHANMPDLLRHAGTTGLLVIDEPGALIETLAITLGDLEVAKAERQSFDGIYAQAMRPALQALEQWLRSSPIEAPQDLTAVLEAQQWPHRADDLRWAGAGVMKPGCTDLVELAKAAVEMLHGGRPPLQVATVQSALRDAAISRRVGNASRVLGAVHSSLVRDTPVKLRAERAQGQPPFAVLTRIDDKLLRALKRGGPTVVLDANAALNAPLYQAALGYSPSLRHFPAADGAPVERVLLRTAKATRKGWLDEQGELDPLSGSFRKALEAALDWALEDETAELLAVITMKPIRELLEDCLKPTDSADLLARYAGRESLLKAARDFLGPTLRRWRGSLLWGHYGAVRGLNSMKHADALITLGDPRPNVSQVANDLTLLGIEDLDGRRVEELARAELEQAHGRLRACRRATRARALHVGTIMPGGTGWKSDVDIREVTGGRPKNTKVDAMDLESLVTSLGGARSASRAVGCHHATLVRYLNGDRRPSHALLLKLRAAAGLTAGCKTPVPSGAETLN